MRNERRGSVTHQPRVFSMIGPDGGNDHVAALACGVVTILVDTDLHDQLEAVEFTEAAHGTLRARTLGLIACADAAGRFEDAAQQGAAAVGIIVLAAIIDATALGPDPGIDAAAGVRALKNDRLGVDIERGAGTALSEPAIGPGRARTHRQADLDEGAGGDEGESSILRVGAVEIHMVSHVQAPVVVVEWSRAGSSKLRRSAVRGGIGPRIFSIRRPR